MERIRVVEQHSFSGTLWAAGWLFTVGYLHLAFWQAIVAIIIWPYDIGVRVAGF